MSKRLTYIARAMRAVEHAMRIVGFGHNPLMSNLRSALRWLRVAKRHTLGGSELIAEVSLRNANTHLQLVLSQIDGVVS